MIPQPTLNSIKPTQVAPDSSQKTQQGKRDGGKGKSLALSLRYTGGQRIRLGDYDYRVPPSWGGPEHDVALACSKRSANGDFYHLQVQGK